MALDNISLVLGVLRAPSLVVVYTFEQHFSDLDILFKAYIIDSGIDYYNACLENRVASLLKHYFLLIPITVFKLYIASNLLKLDINK